VAKKDSNEPKKRRIIKKVETVREKAEKTTLKTVENKGKKGIVRLTLHYITAPLRFIGRPFKKLGRFKLFRILGYILLPKYFRNSWKELRQVTWPTRRESWQLTLAVIVFATVFGGIVTLTDYGLDKIFKQVLIK
jgi:preprotein translocase SecE subunit